MHPMHALKLAIASASFATTTATAQDTIVVFQADNDGYVPAGLDAVGIIPTRVINSDFLDFQSDFTTQRRKADCDRD